MSFYLTRNVQRTRKPCCCFWCLEDILPGSAKVYVTQVYEGDFSAHSFHPECHSAMNRWMDLYGRDNDNMWPEKGSMKRGSWEGRR